jgi:ribosomal protein L11 methyltransferase
MTFWQLTVPTSPDISDGLTNFLWEHGALGVVEEEFPEQPPRLLAFFPEASSSAVLLRAVSVYRDSLRSLGFSVSPAPPELAPLLDGDWAHAWQQSFPSREIGDRLLIVPPWEARAESATGGRAQVIIEPGRAFGTGHHGSTEGCLRLLEQALALGDAAPAVLDVGTGTGILAIAAVKLGAPSVLAIDVDPDAIAAARLNVEKNGCAEHVALALEDPEALPDQPRFGLVVANLLAHTHVGFAACYRRLVAPGGRLVLGGILVGEDERVTAALTPAGFESVRGLAVDGWASLLLGLPAPA